MNCDICHRQPATIHIQEIIDGTRKALHLCGDCATRKDVSSQALQDFTLSEFLTSFGALAEGVQALQEDVEVIYPDIACSHCGTTAQQFQETNMLGCPHCYESMSIILEDMLGELHRGTAHVGSPPRSERSHVARATDEGPMLDLQLDLIQRELQDAVAVENYERAAELRDKLNRLRKKEAV